MRTETQMSPIVRRIQAIARQEFRTFDGQLAAMLHLWQQEHGAIAPVKSGIRKPKSSKPRVKKARIPGMQGKQHTPEARARISEALRLSHAKRRLKKLKTQMNETKQSDVVAS